MSADPSRSKPEVDLRIAAVVNARLRARARTLVSQALARLRESACLVAVLDTRGDDGDAGRLTDLVARGDLDVLVAAGGDGTVGLAAGALLEARRTESTALGFLPLGTGNNAARSFGLRSLRDGEAALRLALAAITAGPRREVDVGRVDRRVFLGSLAIGIDAAVLSLRNELQRHLERTGLDGGYGLYLGGALASLLRRQGGPARIAIDGAWETQTIYGVAAINAPVYAGPLRFDGANDCDDGRLDVLVVSSAWEYLAEYASAWPRFLRVLHGRSAAPSPRLRRARQLVVELERPLCAQADGEELEPSASFHVDVLPCALRICTPRRPAVGLAVSRSAAAGRSR